MGKRTPAQEARRPYVFPAPLPPAHGSAISSIKLREKAGANLREKSVPEAFLRIRQQIEAYGTGILAKEELERFENWMHDPRNSRALGTIEEMVLRDVKKFWRAGQMDEKFRAYGNDELLARPFIFMAMQERREYMALVERVRSYGASVDQPDLSLTTFIDSLHSQITSHLPEFANLTQKDKNLLLAGFVVDPATLIPLAMRAKENRGRPMLAEALEMYGKDPVDMVMDVFLDGRKLWKLEIPESLGAIA